SHDPNHVETYVSLAYLLRRRLSSADQPAPAKEADQLMEDLVTHNEADFHAHVARWKYVREWGNLSQSKNLEVASANVTQALKLAPSEADVLLAAADLEKARKNLDGARTHLETALKLHPKDFRLYQSLAMLELEAGRREPAIAKLNDGVRAVSSQD